MARAEQHVHVWVIVKSNASLPSTCGWPREKENDVLIGCWYTSMLRRYGDITDTHFANTLGSND